MSSVRTIRVLAFIVASILLNVLLVLAEPLIDNIVVSQVGSTSQLEVTYDLSNCDSAIITMEVEIDSETLPDNLVTRVAGAVNRVVSADNDLTIIWDVGAELGEISSEAVRVKLTAWELANPPLYCVLDLAEGAAATTYPINYYASAEALPLGGLAHNIYRSSKLVMRKIIKGSFGMLDKDHPVTLTQDYYTGVFPVTQAQWHHIMGGTPPSSFTDVASCAFRPVERVSYNMLRGSTADEIDFPQTGVAVAEGSFIYTLRERSGLTTLDLPTEAQWEYACRAGTTSIYGDGDENANISGENEYSNIWMNALGRYSYNGGFVVTSEDPLTWATPDPGCPSTEGTAIVGSYNPNGWGLYDMHGNVYEWCRDWFKATSKMGGGTDPEGPDAGDSDTRVKRGGAWNERASKARVFSRGTASKPNNISFNTGFRLVITLPSE